mgnify:CR=1 FL=1
MRRSQNIIYLMFFLISVSAVANVVQADAPLSALMTPDSDVPIDRSDEVSYSGDGNLLAIAFEKDLYVYHTGTRSELDFSPLVLNDDFITSVEFTQDSTNQGDGYLLVGRSSLMTNTPAISVYDLSSIPWSHDYVSQGKEVSSIVTISNASGESFAYATDVAGKQMIYAYYYSDLDTPARIIETTHDSKISCLDYDFENDIFISGSLGRIELNMQDGQMEEHFETGQTIFDCKFSKEGVYAWSSEDGVKIMDSSHNFLQSFTLANTINAQKIIFQPEENLMRLLTNEGGSTLITYSTMGNWEKTDSLALGHVVRDLDINPINGDIAASTYSKYIALYSTNWINPMVTSSPSNDLDHDGIEDQEDEDRDGDGILNHLDVSCDSDNPCNLVSDTDFIRNFEVTMLDNNLIISETVYFSLQDSESLRLIAAETLEEDGYIVPDERTIFNDVFCSKIDVNLLSDTWYGVFLFDNNSVIAGVDSIDYSCGGLTNLAHDSKERISFSWTLSYELLKDVSNNYTLTVTNPPSLGYGMPYDLVHSYPIKLSVTDTKIKTYVIESWFDTTAAFDLEFKGEEEKASIEVGVLVKYLKYTSYGLLSIAFIVISGLLIIRRRNRFSIDEYSMNKRSPPSTKKKTPPNSKRNKKEYGYYNPGRREGDDWNYGDDAGFYYSETYTDYKKASDSLNKKTKVRKIKVDPNKKIVSDTKEIMVNDAKEKNKSRRRVARKRNKQPEIEEVVEVPAEVDDNEEELNTQTIKEIEMQGQEKSIDDLKKVMQEEVIEDIEESKDEEEMMDKALDKYFS